MRAIRYHYFSFEAMNGPSDQATASSLQQPTISIVPVSLPTPSSSTVPSGSPSVVTVTTAPVSWPQQATVAAIPSVAPPTSRQPTTVFVSASNQQSVTAAPVSSGSGSLIIAPSGQSNSTPGVSTNGPFVSAPSTVVPTVVPQINGTLTTPTTGATEPQPLIANTQPQVVPTGSVIINTTTTMPAPATPAQQQPAVANEGISSSRHPPVFNTKSLVELAKETDPYMQLDDEAEEVSRWRCIYIY